MNNQKNKTDRANAFVQFIIDLCLRDKGAAAALRRADNPATEFQSWEYLASFNVDIDKSYERLPFATVASAISKAKADKNGRLGIGAAIASCYEEGKDSDQAKAKLRRLLSSDSVEELCMVLRTLLKLIESRNGACLNYSRLLNQLLKFRWNDDSVKATWAQDFYSSYKTADSTEEESA